MIEKFRLPPHSYCVIQARWQIANSATKPLLWVALVRKCIVLKLLTKHLKLSLTKLSVRAVRCLGLHDAPAACFFGASCASKPCIRIAIQIQASFRKPVNQVYNHNILSLVYFLIQTTSHCCMVYCTCSIFSHCNSPHSLL